MMDGSSSGVPEFAQLKMFVLDVLQHDVAEPLTSVIAMINNAGCLGWREFSSRDFQADEIVAALKSLALDRLIVLYEEDRQTGELTMSNVDPRLLTICGSEKLWFGSTDMGKQKWSEWTPPEPPPKINEHSRRGG